MNKYKTIEASPQRQTLQDAIENRLITNRIARMTIEDNQLQKTLMSTNKSIIYIKLPKKVQKNLNSFRSSLYESSLKRLKQQKVTILKESKIPNITNKKTFQSFEQEVIRKVIKQKGYQKKFLFQIQEQKKHSFLLQKLQQKSQEQQEEPRDYSPTNNKITSSQRKSTFQFDGAALGFNNLKQKYLELRQLSLNNKRKSQLLEKHQNRRNLFDEQFNNYNAKVRMDKQIVQHMNRYMKKDFFQTKINGLKTTIYPNQKSNKKAETTQYKNQQPGFIQSSHKLSNFIKRKKMKSCAQNVSGQYPRSSFQIKTKDQTQLPIGLKVIAKANPELFKIDDCTPWQTDMINCD